MSERAPHSRVYWTIRNDPRLADIYPNDALLATWLRLLLAADMSWPAPADVPASVRRRSLASLRVAGVIELLPGGLFRFHGLDTERGDRRSAAQASAGQRWGSERGPSGTPHGMRSDTERHARRDETRRDETSVAPAREGASPDDGPLLWLSRHRAGVPEGNGLHVKLIGLCERHGPEKVIAAWEAMPPGTGRTYILGAENVLDVIVRAPSPKDERAAEAEAESKRRLAATQRHLAELRGET